MAIVTGDSANNTLAGTGVADTITGNAGNDTINAGAGNDLVTAGPAADTIVTPLDLNWTAAGANGANLFGVGGVSGLNLPSILTAILGAVILLAIVRAFRHSSATV